MNSKNSFNRTLVGRDVLMLTIGSMIGWGWVISVGDWLITAGLIGTVIAFGLGSIMIAFVGLTYAELTTAIPKCGGEHIFSLLGLGRRSSFICGWSIAFSYVAIAAFESGAVSASICYLLGPECVFGYMYSIESSPVYFSNVLIGVVTAIIITYLNISGIKKTTKFQNILVAIMIMSCLVLMVSALLNGSVQNIISNLYINDGGELTCQEFFSRTFKVLCMVPFLFIGFDVLPQTIEEINIKVGKVGKIMMFSIFIAAIWYFVVVFSVALCMSREEIQGSYKTGLVAVDAIKKVTKSNFLGNVIILGGICGIISSWNAMLLGGSRAIYSLANEKMIPDHFSMVSEKYNTPVLSVIVVGLISFVAPFFGRNVLLWLIDVSGFGACIAYMLVAFSFLMIRRKYPDLKRP